MAGNPFLNFFIQSAAEAPAFILGNYMGKCGGGAVQLDGKFPFATRKKTDDNFHVHINLALI